MYIREGLNHCVELEALVIDDCADSFTVSQLETLCNTLHFTLLRKVGRTLVNSQLLMKRWLERLELCALDFNLLAVDSLAVARQVQPQGQLPRLMVIRRMIADVSE